MVVVVVVTITNIITFLHRQVLASAFLKKPDLSNEPL